jgi:putative membrane protein
VLQTLLVVGAAVAVVVILSRNRPSGESPLEILRRRYAAGEISKEEFESARRTLGA